MSENQEADLYRVLGATSGDTVQHLKHKYQQLVLQYHPDRFSGNTPSEAESALKRFLEIDAAWRILKDRESRRQYDLKLRARRLAQDWPLDSAVRVEDMTWDGDAGVYTHGCRCGGAFAVSEEEMKKPEEEEGQQQEEEEGGGGLLVCCDTCSLSVFVTARKEPPQPRGPV